MTISRLNLGTAPSGVGGDTERSAFVKIDANFGDNANAASRLVGTGDGNVPEFDAAAGIGKTGLGRYPAQVGSGFDLNNLTAANKYYTGFYMGSNMTNAPSSDWYMIQLLTHNNSYCIQIATMFTTGVPRQYVRNQYANSWSPWREMYSNKSDIIYNTTTASSPNVFVTSSGELQRSTSSERYKKDIAHIELSDKEYAAIRQVKPIAYKSTAEVDNPNHTFQSFSAEELAKASPTLVLWETEETVIDESTGLPVTRKLPERRPAGLNLNGLVALQHAFSLKQADLIDKQAKRLDTQDKLIKDLTKRLEALENAGK